jgi:ATP-binding cassette subfamily B protein
VVAHPWLRERDLRQRTHTGALARSSSSTRSSASCPSALTSGERALAREQEGLLVEWGQAGTALLRTVVATSGAQLAVGFGLAAWLLFSRAASPTKAAAPCCWPTGR